MADEYVPQPYPKWLPEHGLVVQNEAEERAVIDGTAIITEVVSAFGSTYVISGYREKPKPEPKPEPKPKPKPEPEPATPAAMLKAADEAMPPRRNKKRKAK